VGLDSGENVEMPLLDIPTGCLRIAWHVVDVEFDRGCASVLHRARIGDQPSGVMPLRLPITGI
jgi:hypothetical protein